MTIGEIATIISIIGGIATLVGFLQKQTKIAADQKAILERLIVRTDSQEKDIEENKAEIKENREKLGEHEVRIVKLETKRTRKKVSATDNA